jgi:hypothetical protein
LFILATSTNSAGATALAADEVVEGVVAQATQTRITLRTASDMLSLRVDRDTQVTLDGRTAKPRDLKPGDVATAAIERGGVFEPVALRVDALRPRR